MNNDLYERLVRKAVYAIRSNDEHLVYQTYGETTMAYDLDAINKEQFHSLHDALAHDWMNAGSELRAGYAKTVKVEDFQIERNDT